MLNAFISSKKFFCGDFFKNKKTPLNASSADRKNVRLYTMHLFYNNNNNKN